VFELLSLIYLLNLYNLWSDKGRVYFLFLASQLSDYLVNSLESLLNIFFCAFVMVLDFLQSFFRNLQILPLVQNVFFFLITCVVSLLLLKFTLSSVNCRPPLLESLQLVLRTPVLHQSKVLVEYQPLKIACKPILYISSLAWPLFTRQCTWFKHYLIIKEQVVSRLFVLSLNLYLLLELSQVPLSP